MKTARSLCLLTLAFSAAPAFAVPLPQMTDPNLLSGLAAIPADEQASTIFNASYDVQYATDGTGGHGGANHDFVFQQSDPDERLALTGFDSALTTIRVWTGSDLAPGHITVYSSTTSQTSINSADYSSTLVPLTVLPAGSWTPGTDYSLGMEYRDFSVTAPAGTQSLLFDFGATNTGNPQIPGFVRIAEVQAFVPEPASLGLLGLAGLGVLARRRRA